MKKPFIRLAFRNIIKHKLSTIINIIGLSVSFAVFMMITMYIVHEKSYDEYHLNKEQIYKVEFERKLANEKEFTSAGPYPLAKMLVENYPEVIDAFKVKTSGVSLKHKEQKLNNLCFPCL